MATLRHHARIDAPADEVWAIVTDPVAIKDWPGIDDCVMDGDDRVVTAMGAEIREAIVTNDGELRRFQYSIVDGPLTAESHLATIDVIEDGDGTFLVYHCDVSPDELAPLLDGIIAAGTQAIAAQFS